MVSSINSVRIWTQQAALKAFNEAAADRESGTSGSSLGSLADMLYADSQDDDGEDTALSSLIGRLQQQAMTGGAAATEQPQGSIDDISSDAFMTALQQKIDALAASPETKAMAQAMQAALEAGTLTVTDVIAGERITGRDLTEQEESARQATDTDKAEPVDADPSQAIAPVETSDWSTYLREHLQRDPYGKYVRNGDSSHIDRTTGASSYFGMIGDTYYYLSWTAPKAVADGAAQI